MTSAIFVKLCVKTFDCHCLAIKTLPLTCINIGLNEDMSINKHVTNRKHSNHDYTASAAQCCNFNVAPTASLYNVWSASNVVSSYHLLFLFLHAPRSSLLTSHRPTVTQPTELTENTSLSSVHKMATHTS